MGTRLPALRKGPVKLCLTAPPLEIIRGHQQNTRELICRCHTVLLRGRHVELSSNLFLHYYGTLPC